MKRLLAALVALFVTPLFFASYAYADAASDELDAIYQDDPLLQSLGSLRFGDDRKAVVTKLREEWMTEKRRDRSLRSDRVQMQRALKGVRERAERFNDTYTELKGRSEFTISVIGDEFIANNNEAFLRLSDGRSQRYFFFYRGRFYKYFVAYNQNYLDNVDFETFIAASIQKYGRPVDLAYDEENPDEDILLSVEWKSSHALLKVNNKQQFFGTYTMTFAEPKVYESWARMKKVKPQTFDTEVPSSVQALVQTGTVTTRSSAVTSIVGATNIDIDSVIPKDKKAEAERERLKKEAEEKKREEAAKKKKKKKKKRKTVKDLKGVDTKGTGGGLIIY